MTKKTSILFITSDQQRADCYGFEGRRVKTPHLDEMAQWQGMVAPAGTPPEIIARLHSELLRAMRLPAVIEKLSAIGMDSAVSATPEEFTQMIVRETRRWPEVFKAAGIQAE